MDNFDALNARIEKLEASKKRLQRTLLGVPLVALLAYPVVSISENNVEVNTRLSPETLFPDGLSPVKPMDKPAALDIGKFKDKFKNYQGKVIVADGFVVKDPINGKELIQMYRNPETRLPEINMFDGEGNLRAALSLSINGMSNTVSLDLASTEGGMDSLRISNKGALAKSGDNLTSMTGTRLLMKGNKGTIIMRSNTADAPEVLLQKKG